MTPPGVHCRSPVRTVLDDTCNKLCNDCRSSIRKGKVPEFALAKGLWIGKVPKELSDLRFIEKLLIARLHHNCCFVHVASGLRKMTSHVVAFQAPTPKLYHALPPPVEDISEVLAILFTGPTRPTSKDFERTPLLIRRNAVAKALEWLKLFNLVEIEYYLKNRFFTCFLWYSYQILPVALNPYPWWVRVRVHTPEAAGIPVSSTNLIMKVRMVQRRVIVLLWCMDLQEMTLTQYPAAD